MTRRAMAVLLTIVAILAAGWLALRRADIPYDTLESIYSVEDTRFLTLSNGLKIHYTDTGPRDRSAIVLVHGFSASLHTWADWKKDLETSYRVITLDLPGHGLSRAEEAPPSIERFVEVVDEVADKLSVDRFTLAGSSMGGHTAWSYAVSHPDRVQGLILVAASGWPTNAEDRKSSPFIFKLMSNGLARKVLKDLDMTSMVRSGLEKSYTDQSFVTDELVDRYVSLSRAPGHRDALLSIMANRVGRPVATAETLSVLDMPILILWGADDNLVPVSHASKFANAIEDAELVVFEGVGHLPQEEAAADSLEVVRDFMVDVEWNTVEAEEIEPAGDPRLVEDRVGGE